jgi:hypothetical protein
MRFLFTVDDEPVTRGTPLRPVSVGVLFLPRQNEIGASVR